jgi:hypothetical protein
VNAPTLEDFVGRGVRAQNAADRQTMLWATPDTAKFGAFVERLTEWCNGQRGVVTWNIYQAVTARVERGKRGAAVRGFGIDIRRGGTSSCTFTAATLAELAKVGDQWLDEQVSRKAARK